MNSTLCVSERELAAKKGSVGEELTRVVTMNILCCEKKVRNPVTFSMVGYTYLWRPISTFRSAQIVMKRQAMLELSKRQSVAGKARNFIETPFMGLCLLLPRAPDSSVLQPRRYTARTCIGPTPLRASVRVTSSVPSACSA